MSPNKKKNHILIIRIIFISKGADIMHLDSCINLIENSPGYSTNHKPVLGTASIEKGQVGLTTLGELRIYVKHLKPIPDTDYLCYLMGNQKLMAVKVGPINVPDFSRHTIFQINFENLDGGGFSIFDIEAVAIILDEPNLSNKNIVLVGYTTHPFHFIPLIHNAHPLKLYEKPIAKPLHTVISDKIKTLTHQ